MKKVVNKKNKHKISNKLLWGLTALSFVLCFWGFFHIPILSSFGINVFPNRNPFWIIILLIVIVCTLPFVFCVQELILRKRERKTDK